ETETVFSAETTSAEIPADAVPQKPEITCSGSHIYQDAADGEGHNTTDALCDGDLSTEWIPFAPMASQTILMDLKKVKTVCGIRITLGKNAVLPTYRIEGSADRSGWTILADSKLREPSVTEKNGFREISEAISGEYRYIKLLWLGAESNTSVKTIAEIALYAEENG
ncbi:MAG: discoidin domain-containing protein, partial [Clostridia bacterium]|nr:discoidin domain-containing protein [Clostridia bacterium]